MPPKPRICPSCREPMDYRSTICRKCFKNGVDAKKFGKSHTDYRGKLKSISLEPLYGDNWSYQFAGLFAGEGTATILATNKNSFVPQVSITLREDDRDTLDDIYSHLSGHVHLDTHGLNPQLRWSAGPFTNTFKVLKFVQYHTVMPVKKLRDVELVIAFCEWRKNQPFHVYDWSSAQKMRENLLAVRQYPGLGC